MNLVVTQGCDYPFQLTPLDSTGNPVDIQGCRVHSQGRSGSYTGPVVFDISTDSGGIVIGVDNKITCTLTADQTLLLVPSSTIYYDVMIYYSGGRYQIQKGSVVVLPEVTEG